MKSQNEKSAAFILSIVGAVLFFVFPLVASAALEDDIYASHKTSGYNYQLSPGEYYQDVIRLQNLSDEAVELMIYAADSTPTGDGRLAFKQKRQNMTDIGSWIRFYPIDPPSTTGEIMAALYDLPDKVAAIEERCTIVQVPAGASYDSFRDYLYGELQSLIAEPEFVYLEALSRWCNGVLDYQIALQPGDELAVPFVIIIPDDVAPGEHVGGIMVEAAQPPSVTALAGSGQTERLEIAVKETVPGEIIREVALTSFIADPDDKGESYQIEVGLQNDGNVSQDLEVAIVVKDKIFNKESFLDRQKVTILRNSALTATFNWPVPKFGLYSLKAAITVDTAAGQEIIETPEQDLRFIPWLEIFLFLGGLILISALVVFLHIRHEDKRVMAFWQPYVIKKNDTVEFLAEKCDVKPRMIIRVNDLPRPYILVPGQTILLPPPLNSASKRVPVVGVGDKITDAGRNSKKLLDVSPARSVKGLKTDSQISKEIEGPKRPRRFGWVVSIIIIVFGVVASLTIIRLTRDTGEINNQETPPIDIESQEPGSQINSEAALPEAPAIIDDNLGNTEATSSAETLPEVKELQPQDIEVWVLNGSGIPGLAGQMAELLKNENFPVSYVGNAEHFGYATTTVFYQLAEDRHKAEFVGRTLRDLGYSNVVLGTNIDATKITIIIGSN